MKIKKIKTLAVASVITALLAGCNSETEDNKSASEPQYTTATVSDYVQQENGDFSFTIQPSVKDTANNIVGLSVVVYATSGGDLVQNSISFLSLYYDRGDSIPEFTVTCEKGAITSQGTEYACNTAVGSNTYSDYGYVSDSTLNNVRVDISVKADDDTGFVNKDAYNLGTFVQ